MQLLRSPTRKLAIANLHSIAQKEIREAMDKKIKPALVKSHEKVVEDWTSDVGFAARTYIRKDSITVYVYPTGEDKEIWNYVDRGTKAHPIKAKNKPRLAFMWGGPGSYVPKTLARPARTVQGGGYVKNPTLRTPYQVQHPGSEGRGFTKQIARDIEPFFHKEINNAFRRVARKASSGG